MRRIRFVTFSSLGLVAALIDPSMILQRFLSFLLCTVLSFNNVCSINLATFTSNFSDNAAYSANPYPASTANITTNSLDFADVQDSAKNSEVAQATSLCGSGSVIVASTTIGSDGKTYFVSYDYRLGIEPSNSTACGREYLTQPDPSQPGYGTKLVYLVDGFKRRVSGTTFTEQTDGSLVAVENGVNSSGSGTSGTARSTDSSAPGAISSLDDGTGITAPRDRSITPNTNTNVGSNTTPSIISSAPSAVKVKPSLTSTGTAGYVPSRSLTSAIKINFQPSSAPVPSGYTKDIGAAYSDTQGFGWVRQDSLSGTRVPLDVTTNTRDRNRSGIEQRLDTIIHMQYSGGSGVTTPAAWEYAVANGTYSVTVSVGDAPGVGGVYDSQHTINVESTPAISLFQATTAQEYQQATAQVNVSDGKLTIDAIGGNNTKLNYIEFVSITPPANAKINFQPNSAPVPSGYTKDIGAAYSSSQGFGWVRQDSLSGTRVPLDVTANTRDRNRSGIEQRLDTIIHMQYSGSSGITTPAAWEYAVANGTYSVTVSVGDTPGTGGVYDSQHTINIEGTPAISLFQATPAQEYRQATAQVSVSDGKLTIDAIGGNNTKLNYVEIAAAGSSSLTLENLDGVPYADRLVFNRIGSLASPPSNGVHNVASLRLKNGGGSNLQITGLPISGPWEFASAIALPVDLPPAGQIDISLRFIASNGDLHNGTLTIQSNDPTQPNKVIELAGFWQSVSEGGQEPSLTELMSLFSYQTTIAGYNQALNHNGLVQSVGNEILSSFWRRGNTAQPVTLQQLSAFHTQGNTATVYWHNKGSNTLNTIVTHAGIDGQSILPHKNGSTTLLAKATFTPTTTFGFKVDGEWSDSTKNNKTADLANGCPGPCGHHVRFWSVKDRQNNIVPDTWFMSMDYSGINYDFNDNLYLISNIKPEPRTALHRIDVGSDIAYTDADGNVWSPDTGLYEPSSAPADSLNPPQNITNTVDDPIYLTGRGTLDSSTPQELRSITYNLPVSPAGTVLIKLHFAELNWGAPGGGPGGLGKRVFDVIAEGTSIVNNLDITATAGGAINAMVLSAGGIQVNDGVLNLTFKADVDFPTIAGIEVNRAAP